MHCAWLGGLWGPGSDRLMAPELGVPRATQPALWQGCGTHCPWAVPPGGGGGAELLPHQGSMSHRDTPWGAVPAGARAWVGPGGDAGSR